MRLDTAADMSTRHSQLLAEADAARLAERPSFALGALLRKAGAQIATSAADVRAASHLRPAKTPAKP